MLDGDHRYELNGDDSRTLAAVGAFRVVAEDDLRDPRNESNNWREPDLRHLRDEGLTRSVALEGRERAVTLTERGQRLLEAIAATVMVVASRPSTLASADRVSYRTTPSCIVPIFGRKNACTAKARRSLASFSTTSSNGSIRSGSRSTIMAEPTATDDRIATCVRLKNGRASTTCRTSTSSVHFPDFRIEYELDGCDRHEDIEVVTEHYRGAHAEAVARAGFRCHGSSGRNGGRPFDPRVAEDFI